MFSRITPRLRFALGLAALQGLLVAQVGSTIYFGSMLAASPVTTPVSLPVAGLLGDRQPAPPVLKGLADEAARFTEPFEGRRHRVYTDTTDHRTIGVGFNLDRATAGRDLAAVLGDIDVDALRRGRVSLTNEQVTALFRRDITAAINRARREVAGFDALPRSAQLVVVDMVFNLGSLSKWPRLRGALAAGDFGRCADHMADSRWATQTGRRARHHIALMRRLPAASTVASR